MKNGFGLFELLISLLIFSISILALLKLQLISLNQTRMNYQHAYEEQSDNNKKEEQYE